MPFPVMMRKHEDRCCGWKACHATIYVLEDLALLKHCPNSWLLCFCDQQDTEHVTQVMELGAVEAAGSNKLFQGVIEGLLQLWLRLWRWALAQG